MSSQNKAFDVTHYWQERYAHGEGSGKGSEGRNYEYKRDYINQIIEKHKIGRIVDFGCGDGTQIRELRIHQYHGIDIAESSILRCRKMYANHPGFRFEVYGDAHYSHYDLAMSLDVLYHIVAQDVYESYLQHLFRYSNIHIDLCQLGSQRIHGSPYLFSQSS